MRKLTKVGLGLFVSALMIGIAIEASKGEEARRRERLHKVAIGSTERLKTDTGQKSIGAHHELSGVIAWLKCPSVPHLPLAVSTPEQKPWADMISVETRTVEDIPIYVSNMDAVKPLVEVRIPNDTRLIGQEAVITIHGAVRFPTITLKEAVFGSEFDEKEATFNHETGILLVATADEAERTGSALMGVAGCAGTVGLLMLTGSLIRFIAGKMPGRGK